MMSLFTLAGVAVLVCVGIMYYVFFVRRSHPGGNGRA
jgi:predicted exporter